jgi:D-proline reductase (dithiol) PrdB
MEIDSFRYVSRLIARYYKLSRVEREPGIPWTPLAGPLSGLRFGLVTTGGLYHRGHEPPFDLERERREPTWGDPSFRTLPVDIKQEEVGVAHHHIRADDILADMNILLPIQRGQELVAEGRIGSLAGHAYSFMGYQGFPANLRFWKEVSGPEVTGRLLSEGVQCVLLSSA